MPPRKPGSKPGRRPGKKIHTPSPYLYPVNRRWKVDYDYVNRLDDEAKAYLAQFTDEYYGNDFGFDEPMHPAGEERRERYRQYNAGTRDISSNRPMYSLPAGDLDAFTLG